MNIYEFKRRIESLGDTMNFCIESVFSWRGSYREPACSISTRNTTKEHNLEMLERLLNNLFWGWKGGEYTYDITDEIHFESDYGSWTDGKYLYKFLMDNGDNEDVRKIFGYYD